MEQNLAKLTLGQITGEHFLRVEEGLTLAQVVGKLRDHQCAAAVYQEGDQWRVISADILPELLLRGTDLLQQPVSALAQPLTTLKASEPVEQLRSALNQSTWVGAVHEGTLVSLLHWTSWARFTAHRRVASPYLFSPEWGRNVVSMANV